MLFSKLFTSFAFAAMAIAPVACAPTAEPEVSVVEKRTSIGDYTRTCYSNVQTHCTNINNCISGNGGVINVDITAGVIAELQSILTLCTNLYIEFQGHVWTSGDAQDCIPVFVLIVQLLTTLFITISGACTGGVIADLAAVVLQISGQVTGCSGLLQTTLTGLINGLLLLLNELLESILNGLSVNITTCISAFTTACNPYQGY